MCRPTHESMVQLGEMSSSVSGARCLTLSEVMTISYHSYSETARFYSWNFLDVLTRLSGGIISLSSELITISQRQDILIIYFLGAYCFITFSLGLLLDRLHGL